MNFDFTYTIKRSKRRKTASIIIKHAEVRVLAPDWLSQNDIFCFLSEKEAWIKEHLEKQSPKPEPVLIKDGLSLFLFGKSVTLCLAMGKKSMLEFDALSGKLYITLSSRVSDKNAQGYLLKMLQQWFSEQLENYLETHLACIADKMKLVYHKSQVKNFKSKWGCCNSKAELAFNWRLAMMPEHLIDSVIIHELAHLRHMDHSPRFWSLVGSFDCEYKHNKKQLSEFSKGIFI